MKNSHTKMNTRSKNMLFSLSLICLLMPMISFAQSDFITRWEVNSGPNTLIRFKKDASAQVNYSWSGGGTSGSGTFPAGLGTATISVPGGGQYILNIEPQNLNRFYMDNTVDPEQLLGVEQWGSVSWTDMTFMFRDCLNMDITASDVPDLSNVTIMSAMFLGCSSISTIPNVHQWDVSGVLDISAMFQGATSFSGIQANGGIGAWNTSQVTSMLNMFLGASIFNGDLSNWNTGNVEYMVSMFGGAEVFNQNIGNWDTGNVIDFSNMFWGATNFNQNLNNWNIQNATFCQGMFESATSYNQPMSNWDVSSVVNMNKMFSNATSFAQDLTNWDVSSVQSMNYMFQNTLVNHNFGTWEIYPSSAFRMFEGSAMSCENYSSTLIAWRNQPGIPLNVLFTGQFGMEYGTNAAIARGELISTLNWTITDDTPSGVECTQSLGLDNLESQINIYPNPAQDVLSISSEANFQDITIISVVGELVYTGTKTNNIDVSDLKSGVYIIKCLLENKQVVTKRFIKN